MQSKVMWRYVELLDRTSLFI